MPGALEHHVDRAADDATGLDDRRQVQVVGVPHGVAAERASEVLSRRRRFDHRDVGPPAGDQRGQHQLADGSGADDHRGLVGLDPRERDAVQRDGERFGERRLAEAEAIGQGEQLMLILADVRGEGAVFLLGSRRVAGLAQRRSSGATRFARAAAHRGPADDRVTDTPAPDRVPDRGHHAGPLVTAHAAGPSPALERHVDVRPAHTAVTDLDQYVVGPELGGRLEFDREIPATLQYGGGHFGHGAQLSTGAASGRKWTASSATGNTGPS